MGSSRFRSEDLACVDDSIAFGGCVAGDAIRAFAEDELIRVLGAGLDAVMPSTVERGIQRFGSASVTPLVLFTRKRGLQ
ncbi:MAG: hypothetical protein AB8E87_03025 [Prochlorococcus sp.]